MPANDREVNTFRHVRLWCTVPRMQNSNRPRRLVKPFGALAGSGFIRSVPIAPQPGGAASYDTGFPPETFQPVASGGSPPDGKDMNGVLFDSTGSAAWAAAGGIAMYDAAYATAIGGYPAYALLASTTPGVLWQCTGDNNMSNPDAGGGGWTQVTVSADTTSDFYRLPGGIIEQWGEVNFTSSSEPVVSANLKVPFSNAFYNVVVSPVLNSPSNVRDSWVQLIRSSKTTTGFSVQYQYSRDDRTGLDGFTWRAVGR